MGEPDVAEDGAVANDSHVRLAHGNVFGRLLRRAWQVEKVFVKGHADGEVAARFGLEAGDRVVAERFVGFPIAVDNGDEEFVVEIKELLGGVGGHC